MRTGDVAKMMGVTLQTVINWTQRPEMKPFLSKESLLENENQTQRDFDESDIRTINTIRVLKDKRMKWEDIAEKLQQGHRELDLPMGAYITKTISAADQVAQLMAMRAEVNTTLALLDESNADRENLRRRIVELESIIADHQKIIYERVEEKTDKVHAEYLEILLRERMAAAEEKVELMVKLKLLENELDRYREKPPEKKKYYTED
jgi:DNA-binding transcriptional MerR regulator